MRILYQVQCIERNDKIKWKIKPFLSIFLFKRKLKCKKDKIFISLKSAKKFIQKTEKKNDTPFKNKTRIFPSRY